MVVALLALFAALSGTAVATTSALITGRQIKNSSITGVDIKNKSLTPADFRGSLRGPRGLRGLTGVQGAPGPQGVQGVAGSPGRSALTPLQSGEIVYGTIGAVHYLSANAQVAANASLPVPAPVALDDAHVTVDGSDEASNECTGTSAAPTAPPGYVCIYPYVFVNTVAASLAGHIFGGSDATAGSKWGFQMTIAGPGGGQAGAFGTWAYTAP
jgi:hypothetical protein